MNHRGELSRLTKIARPDIAVITNIGTAHIENLGSREGIAQAKLEILEGLRPDGAIVLNGDEPLLTGSPALAGKRVVRFGLEMCIRDSFGMSKLDKNQVEYIALNEKDKVEHLESERGGILGFVDDILDLLNISH